MPWCAAAARSEDDVLFTRRSQLAYSLIEAVRDTEGVLRKLLRAARAKLSATIIAELPTLVPHEPACRLVESRVQKVARAPPPRRQCPADAPGAPRPRGG